jgi:hypothetical protein
LAWEAEFDCLKQMTKWLIYLIQEFNWIYRKIMIL